MHPLLKLASIGIAALGIAFLIGHSIKVGEQEDAQQRRLAEQPVLLHIIETEEQKEPGPDSSGRPSPIPTSPAATISSCTS